MGDVTRLASYPRILVATLAVVASFSYGSLFYGFSVLITRQAAGEVFSTSLLSTAYGGAVVSGGITAAVVGRVADRNGIRGILAVGGLLAFAGLAAFGAARQDWHVLAAWWLLLGPASAMTFYEPAYVAIQQWFSGAARIQAIALLAFLGGLSGPVSIPVTTALIEAFGWRVTATTLGAAVLVVTTAAAAFVVRRAPRAAESQSQAEPGRRLPLTSPRFLLFSLAAMLAYGSLEAIIIHRVARFEEAGFTVATVAMWAAIAGLLSIPGRYLLPSMARHRSGSAVFAVILAIMGLSTALAIHVSGTWQLIGHFVLFGLVFGAALPLRAVVMGHWYATPHFGVIMGVQAAGIAIARAGFPLGVGILRDRQGGYDGGVAVLTVALLVSVALVVLSARAKRESRTRYRELSESRPAISQVANDQLLTGENRGSGF